MYQLDDVIWFVGEPTLELKSSCKDSLQQFLSSSFSCKSKLGCKVDFPTSDSILLE